MKGKRNKRPKVSRRGKVILEMRDGTTQVIEGENLCLDLVYRDGQPYLVVKEQDAGSRERAGGDPGQEDPGS